jgi:tripartite-type tricarboxylate transporter receptor subunit TctC
MLRSAIAAWLCLFACAASAQAQVDAAPKYPTKPIKLIVGFSPGGSTDILARLVGRRLQESLGQSVVVENKASTGGIVGALQTAKAPPDGYTLMVGTSGQFVFNPAVHQSLPYGPQRDFTPISVIATFPLIVSVKSDSKIRTVSELVKFSKENPKQSNYASSTSSFQLASELLKERTGIQAEHVPYKGSAESMNAVASGEITFTLLDPGPASGAIKGNLLRGLAVTSAKRLAAFPDIPTLKEQGVDLQIELWIGLFAPAKTPAPIVRLLERETAKAVTHPESVKSMAQLGLEPASSSSEDFARQIAQEIQVWSALAKQKNIKAE